MISNVSFTSASLVGPSMNPKQHFSDEESAKKLKSHKLRLDMSGKYNTKNGPFNKVEFTPKNPGEPQFTFNLESMNLLAPAINTISIKDPEKPHDTLVVTPNSEKERINAGELMIRLYAKSW